MLVCYNQPLLICDNKPQYTIFDNKLTLITYHIYKNYTPKYMIILNTLVIHQVNNIKTLAINYNI